VKTSHGTGFLGAIVFLKSISEVETPHPVRTVFRPEVIMWSQRFLGLSLTLLLLSCQTTPNPAVNPTLLQPQAVTLSALDTMPFQMDSSNQAAWWSPLTEFSGSTYLAYNAPGSSTSVHQVHLAKRTSAGVWSSACLKNSSGACIEYTDDIGHNQPSIAIDGDGFIHAFVSMHNNNWRYFRSNNSQDIGTVTSRASEMPDQGGQYTYPVLTQANGDVYLIIRAISGTGRSGRLYRFNNTSNTWTQTATFAFESGKTVYPDDIQADANGDLHLTWAWFATDYAGPIRHVGSYLRYRPSNNTFYNAAGSVMTTPVTTSSNMVYQPLEGSEVFSSSDISDSGQPGLQGAKIALINSNGVYRPSIAYRYRASQGGGFTVRRARWDGSTWQRETVFAGDTYAAVETSHDGNTVRVYYAKRTTAPDRVFVAERSSSSVWAETSLAPSKPVERIAALMRPNGEDVLYLVAPTAVSSSLGELYYRTAAR
jgi:hypothetical protein